MGLRVNVEAAFVMLVLFVSMAVITVDSSRQNFLPFLRSRVVETTDGLLSKTEECCDRCDCNDYNDPPCFCIRAIECNRREDPDCPPDKFGDCVCSRSFPLISCLCPWGHLPVCYDTCNSTSIN